MDRKKWILLITSCVEEGGLTPVQLQKSLFILGQKIPKVTSANGGYYNFIAYNYGPFCLDVYKDAESLALDGYLNIYRDSGQRFDQYSITKKGLILVESLKDGIDKDIYIYICQLIAWIKQLTFRQLIQAVYKIYPEFSTNSVFRG